MNLPFANPGARRDEPGSEYDARPSIAIRRKDNTAWWFAGGALVAAALLFSALEARRQAVGKGNGQVAGTSYASPEAIPELTVPAQPVDPSELINGPWRQPADERQRTTAAILPPLPPARNSAPAYQPQMTYSESSYPPPLPMPAQNVPASPPAFDAPPSASGPAEAGRVRAGRL